MGRDMRTVAQLARGSLFTEGQLRRWILEAQQNGLAAYDAIERAGSRVLIDVDAFHRWRAEVDKRRRGTPVVNTMEVRV